MTHQHATIEDTIYFWFGSNDTSGSGDDGASAAADVRLAGAAAGAAPVLSPTPTLLSHASFPPGAYEVAVAATVANGFAAGNTYSIFCTLTVDSQNPTGFIGSFTLAPIIANIKEVSDDSGAANNLELDYDGTGYNKSNSTIGTTTLNADMVTEPPTAVQNRQEMDSNSTELAKIGTIPALDGAAQTVGAAIAKLADDNDGADFDAGTDSLQEIRDRGDIAWITGSGGDATEAKQDTIIARIPAALVSGRMSSDAVAISGSTTAANNLEASTLIIIIAAAAAGTLSTTQMTTTLTETTDDHYNGRIVIWTSGVLLGQATDITDYDGATKMITYTATTEAPSGGDTFIII